MNKLAVFAGQGAQFPGMAAGYLGRKGFMKAVGRCSEAYKRYEPEFDIEKRMAECDNVEDTRVGQPLLAAVQIALAADAADGFKYYVGHSLGEIAAAVAAGAMSIEEAMGLVYYRADVLQHALGDMSVVMTDASTALQVLQSAGIHGTVSIAAVNDDRMTTLCGADLSSVKDIFRSHKIASKPVPVRYAFHSSLITPEHVKTLEDNLRNKVFTSIETPTGSYFPTGLLTERQLTSSTILSTYDELLCSFNPRCPVYWSQQIRNPVGFGPAIRYLKEFDPGIDSFEELGPKEVLTRFVRPLF